MADGLFDSWGEHRQQWNEIRRLEEKFEALDVDQRLEALRATVVELQRRAERSDLLVTALVYGISVRGGRVPVTILLLTGIAVGSLAASLPSLLMITVSKSSPEVARDNSDAIGTGTGDGTERRGSSLGNTGAAGAGATGFCCAGAGV